MDTTHHAKLIRTKIPDIIRSKGEECGIRMISGKELTSALIQKVAEELRELFEAKTQAETAAELADVQEVVDAIEQHVISEGGANQELTDKIADVHRSMAEVAATIEGIDVVVIKEAKRQERGGFLMEDGRGVFLEWTRKKESVKIKGTLLEAGVPNRNGCIYSEEYLDQVWKQLNEKIASGTAFMPTSQKMVE